MGVADSDVKNFLVTKLGLSEESADHAVEIGKYAGAAATGVGWFLVAYELIDKFFGKNDPIWQKLDALINAIKSLEKEVDADKLSEIKNEITTARATIETAAAVGRTYRDNSSGPNRAQVEINFRSPGGLHETLAALLKGKVYRFIPLAYDHSLDDTGNDVGIPGWVNGLKVYGRFYEWDPDAQNHWAKRVVAFETYEQKSAQQPIEWTPSLPEPLLQEGNRKWDGLLCLPAVLYALPAWQSALELLEPFYRLSGQWLQEIESIRAGLAQFKHEWDAAILWTREMPSEKDIKAELGLLIAPELLGIPLPSPPPSGFSFWPCGVLDPIMGGEIINANWWKATDIQPNSPGFPYPLEYWTTQERSAFNEQRLVQRQRLDSQNGFHAFSWIGINIGKLKKPPAYSPSLKAYPVHFSSSGSSTIAFPPAPDHVQLTDPLGTAWTGHRVRSSVNASGRVSVQPNPFPPDPHPRTAVSDVVFGYEIAFTPVGGTTQTKKDWLWPLRLQDPQPGLYHDESGERRKVPYATSHDFKLQADTWETITDGKQREKLGIAKGTIAFTMTVTVADHGTAEWVPTDTKPKRGAIKIDVHADETANNGRSFELKVEIKEIAAVDAAGIKKGLPGFSSSKTYTSSFVMPLDVCRIYVPTNYFDWLRKALERFRHVSRQFGIPGPKPDPDPVLELSLWRLVLEQYPVILQAHLKDLEASMGHRVLPAQALAHLDTALGVLAGQPARVVSVPDTVDR